MNSILLKDGESKQFVAASDEGSGDIVKVDVTINVEKSSGEFWGHWTAPQNLIQAWQRV